MRFLIPMLMCVCCLSVQGVEYGPWSKPHEEWRIRLVLGVNKHDEAASLMVWLQIQNISEDRRNLDLTPFFEAWPSGVIECIRAKPESPFFGNDADRSPAVATFESMEIKTIRRDGVSYNYDGGMGICTDPHIWYSPSTMSTPLHLRRLSAKIDLDHELIGTTRLSQAIDFGLTRAGLAIRLMAMESIVETGSPVTLRLDLRCDQGDRMFRHFQLADRLKVIGPDGVVRPCLIPKREVSKTPLSMIGVHNTQTLALVDVSKAFDFSQPGIYSIHLQSGGGTAEEEIVIPASNVVTIKVKEFMEVLPDPFWGVPGFEALTKMAGNSGDIWESVVKVWHVNGRLIDEDGNSLAQHVVQVRNIQSASYTSHRATSNIFGYFDVHGLEAGEYVCSVYPESTDKQTTNHSDRVIKHGKRFSLGDPGKPYYSTRHEIIMAPPPVVTCQLMQAGKPLRHKKVTVSFSWSDGSSSQDRMFTSEDGQIQFP